MTMRWRLTAAMVSRFISKAANQRLSYACCYGSASSSPISHVLFDVRSRKSCDVISTVVEQPRLGLKLAHSAPRWRACIHSVPFKSKGSKK
jgi:hypothetical protein